MYEVSIGNLSPGLYPLHPTDIYTCELTIIPRVCGDFVKRLKPIS